MLRQCLVSRKMDYLNRNLTFIEIICLAIYWLHVKGNFVEIAIPQGKLKGIFKKTWTNKKFISFTGVPYAKPPIGDLRFESPVPAPAWLDVLDATQYQSECIQDNLLMGIKEVSGSEDCLYINIYTPEILTKITNLLPVMFFTHGGGWMFGSGSDEWYGPEFLLDENIVLVTFNYRLGPLGFISMGDEIIPGNNGLKDQSLALMWVKENVAYFGGDPNRITIFGNSAGGASTHFQTLSPLTRELINGAIIQSGTVFGQWALSSREEAKNKTLTLAEKAGCLSTESNEILKCLKEKDAADLIRITSTFYSWSYDPVVAFRPVVELNSEKSFITDFPENIIKSGKAAKVPIILSITSEDGIIKAGFIFNNSQLMHEFSENLENTAPFVLMYNEAGNVNDITQKIRRFYFNNQKISWEHTSKIVDMLTDSWFLQPLHISAQMHIDYTQAPVYQLIYNYRGPKTYGDLYGDPNHNYGVCHSDELLYLFTTKYYGIYHKNRLDTKAVKTITKLWANFARTGNPTPNDDIPKWEPTKKSLQCFIELTTT